MNKTYFYRKHLRAPFKYMMLVVAVIFLGVILMSFGLMITDDQGMNGTLIGIISIVILVAFLVVSGEMLLMYLLLMKRFKSISIMLTAEGIEYVNAKKKIFIPYEDIVKLEFPSIKYTGGWAKIVYKGGNVRLTVVLEHIGDFISDLKEKMNEREMAYVYNEKKLFSFFKTAVFADESWERLYRNSKLQVATHFLCIIATTIILLLHGNSSDNQLLIIGSVVAPLLGYLVSEVILGAKVRKRVNKQEFRVLPRNPEYEKKVFNIAIIGFSVAYLLMIQGHLMR